MRRGVAGAGAGRLHKKPVRLQAPAAPASAEQPAETGQIYLYGEIHGAEKIYDEEFSLWSDYYHSGGLRHLFVELPYYAAEFLNEWMQADDDKILDALYQDWEGTLGGNPYSKELYRQIKQDCPGTIFHGTDVGHQYDSTGNAFCGSCGSGARGHGALPVRAGQCGTGQALL